MPRQLSYSFCINTLFCACCLAVEGVLDVSCRAVRSNETGIFMISARSGARRLDFRGCSKRQLGACLGGFEDASCHILPSLTSASLMYHLYLRLHCG